MDIFAYYGLTPMTLEQEISAPQTVKDTRAAKIEIEDWCSHMETLISMIRGRAFCAPEIDDASHAALMNEFANKVKRAMRDLEDAASYGIY